MFTTSLERQIYASLSDFAGGATEPLDQLAFNLCYQLLLNNLMSLLQQERKESDGISIPMDDTFTLMEHFTVASGTDAGRVDHTDNA